MRTSSTISINKKNAKKKEERQRLRLYRNEVKMFTKRNFKNLSNIDAIGVHTFHVDHIYPTQKGFLNGVPAELIGHIYNLQIIPAFDNRSKSGKISIIPTLI